MSDTAHALESAFETVVMRIERGCSMRPAGVLKAQPELEEVPIDSRMDAKRRPVRVFRVHGQRLRHEGLREGDYVLVDPSPATRSGGLVLVETNGQPALLQVAHGAEGTTFTDPADGLFARRDPASDYRLLGTFLGIIRKQGFGRSRSRVGVGSSQQRMHGGAKRSPVEDPALVVSPVPKPKVSILRGKLGMLESTCAATANPRLRRALRDEARRVRFQLQNESHHDKLA